MASLHLALSTVFIVLFFIGFTFLCVVNAMLVFEEMILMVFLIIEPAEILLYIENIDGVQTSWA